MFVRRGCRIALWLLLAYFVINFFSAIRHLMRVGDMTYRQAFNFALSALLPGSEHPVLTGSVILGTVIGLIGYYRNRRKKTEAEEEKDEEPAETAAPAEEEIIETQHYSFR